MTGPGVDGVQLVDEGAAPSWWKLQAAPLDGSQLVAVHTAFAIPPVVTLAVGGGAVWSFLLWVPAVVMSTVWGKAKARREGAPPRSVRRDVKANMVVGALVAIPVIAVSAVFGDQMRDGQTTWVGVLGLCTVAVAVAIEPYFRRRYRRSFTAAGKG